MTDNDLLKQIQDSFDNIDSFASANLRVNMKHDFLAALAAQEGPFSRFLDDADDYINEAEESFE